jgi:hypothetical protein
MGAFFPAAPDAGDGSGGALSVVVAEDTGVSTFLGMDCSSMFCLGWRGCAVFGGGTSLLAVA